MAGYRPPSSEPRGKWAKRIHERRRELGLSQQAAFERLAEPLGFSPKSRAAYVALDMGTREPKPPEQAVLAEWLGGYPTDSVDAPSSDQSALAIAIEKQAAAISELAAQVKTLTERQPTGEELSNVLAAAVALAVRETLRAAGIAAELPRP